MASTKSPVLVILPPSHKCLDMDIVLGLARTAFDDAKLHLMDLNLRFTWASGKSLQPADDDADSACMVAAAPARADDRPDISSPTAQAIAPPSTCTSTSANVGPVPATRASIASIKEASLSSFRIFVSDIAPTLSDADILGMCPPSMDILGATFYPPLPLGPNKTMVRSVVFAFAKAIQAKEFHVWVKQEAGMGTLSGTLIRPNVLTYFLGKRVTVGEMMTSESIKAAFLGATHATPFATDSATLASVPNASATLPKDPPEAHDYHWRLIVGNLARCLSKNALVSNLVPYGVALAGASILLPKDGEGRRNCEIVLAFNSESHANACSLWIQKQAELGGGVSAIVPPAATIRVDPICSPVLPISQRSFSSSAATFATNDISPTTMPIHPSLASAHSLALNDGRKTTLITALDSPTATASALPASHVPQRRLPEAHDGQWRIKIGNLRISPSDNDILSSITLSSLPLTGATFHKPKPLGAGRPDLARSVTLAFQSEADASNCARWIQQHAEAGGAIAGMVSFGTEISVSAVLKPTAPPLLADRVTDLISSSTHDSSLHSLPPAPPAPQSPQVTSSSPQRTRLAIDAAPFVPFSSPIPTNPTQTLVSPSTAGLRAPSADAIPEASPSHYRLHVSNLQPDLDLAQIIPALVPHAIKLAGASLYTPRPMGGSRRRGELVRSVKFAFLTEADAKRCQQWIKKDAKGGVTKLAPPGSKVAVGNPMDPMRSDPQPSVAPAAEAAEPMHGRRASKARSSSLLSSMSTTSDIQSASSSSPDQPAHQTVSIYGVDSTKPVATVFKAILGLLAGSIEPVRMGVRNANGRRGVEFAFDSETAAEQFVAHVSWAIAARVFAGITAADEELRVGLGSGGGNVSGE